MLNTVQLQEINKIQKEKNFSTVKELLKYLNFQEFKSRIDSYHKELKEGVYKYRYNDTKECVNDYKKEIYELLTNKKGLILNKDDCMNYLYPYEVTVYKIKEICPMFSDDYDRTFPYIFMDKTTAERCLLDYEDIDCEMMTCGKFEVIEIKMEENDIEDKYKVLNIEDYEEEKKYKIHSYKLLEVIGRN